MYLSCATANSTESTMTLLNNQGTLSKDDCRRLLDVTVATCTPMDYSDVVVLVTGSSARGAISPYHFARRAFLESH
jgi:hypothetical protein